MTTLALDLGASIGWMRGNTVGPIEFGTISLKTTTDLGAWLESAASPLQRVMRGVDDVAVEQPWLGESYYPARKLLGLLGLVYYIARLEGIAGQHVSEIPVPTAKHTMAGHGRAEKDQMIVASAEFWGIDPEDLNEHEADAGAILRVHLFGVREKIRPAKVRSSKGVSILRGPARG